MRAEVYKFIDDLPDNKPEALRPLLSLLSDDKAAVETDLTDDEKNRISMGRERYLKSPASFVPLDSVMKYFRRQVALCGKDSFLYQEHGLYG